MNPIVFALVAVTLAATPAKKPAPTPPTTPTSSPTAAAPLEPDAKVVRTIALDPKRKAIYKLRLVPGVATTVQLPERWKETPICGECVFGNADYKGQLFRLDLIESTQTLTIKNARLPGADPTFGVAPPESFITNVDVTLAGGSTVTFFLELTPDPNLADTRVEVTLPEDEKASTRKTAFDREMAAEFDVRLSEKASEVVLQAALYGTKCRDFLGGPRRTDQMVVRLRQMCRNGRQLWVTFEVENLNNLDLTLAAPTLSGENGIASAKSYFDKTTLLFNEKTRGIAMAELVDPAIPSSRYTLDVVEDGGKGRTVTIDAIDF